MRRSPSSCREMLLLVAGGAFLLSTHVVHADDLPEWRIKELRVTEIHPAEMSEATRARYIAFIRREYPYDRERLIRLRDQETIDDLVRSWDESKGRNFGARNSMAGSASPWLIPRLADFLYGEESPAGRFYPGPEMEADSGFPDATSMVVQEILLDAPEVPKEVKESVHTAWHRRTEAVRQWWESNREHFESERYDLLQPMTDLPAKPWPVADTAVKSGVEVAAPAPAPVESTIPAPSSPPTNASPLAAPMEPPSGGRINPWLVWGAGGLIGAVALILFARARR